MQNHRRRKLDQLSRRLRHPHRQFTHSKTPLQQRHFNKGSKFYGIGHLQFLVNDPPENKRICENETFGFSRKSDCTFTTCVKWQPQKVLFMSPSKQECTGSPKVEYLPKQYFRNASMTIATTRSGLHPVYGPTNGGLTVSRSLWTILG